MVTSLRTVRMQCSCIRLWHRLSSCWAACYRKDPAHVCSTWQTSFLYRGSVCGGLHKSFAAIKEGKMFFLLPICRNQPSCRSDSVHSKTESTLLDWYANAAGCPHAGPLTTHGLTYQAQVPNLISVCCRAPKLSDCCPDRYRKWSIKLEWIVKLCTPADVVGCFT